MGDTLILPIVRISRADVTRCGCPVATIPCDGKIDGEDGLCRFCRSEHRPDFRQPFTDDE